MPVRIIAIAVVFLSLLVLPHRAAGPPMSAAMVMTQAGDSGSGGCGERRADACQMDCVLCHAIAPAGLHPTPASFAYAALRPDVQPQPTSQTVGLDPPVPRGAA